MRIRLSNGEVIKARKEWWKTFLRDLETRLRMEYNAQPVLYVGPETLKFVRPVGHVERAAVHALLNDTLERAHCRLYGVTVKP